VKWTLSESAESALRRQREARDALTDDLLDLSESLRETAEATERSLAASRRGLDVLEDALEKNVAAVRTSNERQKKLRETFASAGLWTWFVLFAVGATFSWAFVYVRLAGDKIKNVR
jgi:hypothetical protein